MSITADFRDQRRADRLAERDADREDKRAAMELRLEADRLKAADEREAKRLEAELEVQREQARAEQGRKDAEAKRKREEADRKAAEEKRAAEKAKRAEVRRAVFTWLRTHPADLFVYLVMTCSVVPAVSSQVAALTGEKVAFWLAALLATMLEGGAWAITFMGKQAEDAGRPTAKYRIGTWTTAGLAGAVNLWHGLSVYAPWVAVVLGVSSLFAVGIWDLRTHGGHGKSKEAKRLEKERERHEKERRAEHEDIAKLADSLRLANPFGVLDEDTAFARAWNVVHAGEPGMTVDLRAIELAANQQLMQELDTELGSDSPIVAEAMAARRTARGSARDTLRAARARMLDHRAHAATGRPNQLAGEPASQQASKPREEAQQPAQQPEKPQVAANKPPAVRAPQTPLQGPRPKQVRPARALAAETARAATPEEAEKEKETARVWLREQRAAGANPGWKQLSEHSNRGETWCRARLREVDAEIGAGPALQLVPGGN